MNWVAYHDRTSGDHQAQFDRLYPLGWRMISLSVYGSRGSERYAAVWVERPGPNWSAVHGVNAAGYQAAFNAAVAAGFRPVLLAATGPANDPVFAGTFEQSPLPVPLTRFGLARGAVTDPSTIDHWTDQARQNGWYPTALAIYGSSSDRRYAGIWEGNPEGVCWTIDGVEDSAASYQARFDALVAVGGRPAYVSVSPDGKYASVFRDDHIGAWIARHNMDSAGYQREFDTIVPQGFLPVSVQAGGIDGGARFAAVFARSDARQLLTWRAPTGPIAVPAIDDVIRQAMQRHRIRGAALALVRDSRLIYARGYALAEPGYPAVEPTTFFRQASVSKTILALAVHRLIQDGRLTLGTTVQSILALQRPDGTRVPLSFDQVTVQHLLEHRSGLACTLRSNGVELDVVDPYGVEPAVVNAFNSALPTPGFALPVNGVMTDRYMATLPAIAPPAPAKYNNWGYFLLGHVVMAVSGASTLIEALNSLLFRPLGITRIRSARTRAEDQPADEARYHPTLFATGPSVVEPDRRLRASGFGGFWNLERDDAAGGLSGAVVDVARLLAMLNVRTGNPILQPAAIANLFTLASAGGGHGFDKARVDNAASGNFYGMKGGSLPESSQNCVRYQTDDISMVVCWNRHDIGEGVAGDNWWYPEFPAVLGAARAYSWGSSDLFPGFGMATFGSGSPGCLLSLFGIGRARSRSSWH
jgi:CubicO group peptidase (beta-lactamase class C family)